MASPHPGELNVKVTRSDEAGIGYIDLALGVRPRKNVILDDHGIVLDFGDDGKLLGIEFLDIDKMPPPTNHEPLGSQVERLAAFILAEIEGEPSQSEGAVDCAIRIMGAQRDELGKSAVDRLGDIGNPTNYEMEAARWIGLARPLLQVLLRQKTTTGNEQLMQELVDTPWPDNRDWDEMIATRSPSHQADLLPTAERRSPGGS